MIIIFEKNQMAEAEAVEGPKRIWVDGERIVVYTGEDLPEGGEE